MKKNGFLTSAVSCDEYVGEKAVLCVFISLALHFFGVVCVKKVWKSGSFSAPYAFLSFSSEFGPVLTSYSVLVWKWRSTRTSAKMGFPCLRIPARLESCYTNVRFDGNFSPTCRSILSLNTSKILRTEPFQVVLLLSSGFFHGSLLFSMENAPQNHVHCRFFFPLIITR